MQPSSGASDGGSVARGRTAARAGPAPVLSEASIRRRREHSRQASLDMAARLGANYERTASYMAQTQSSLRHASVGSEASMTGSVRRLRARRSAERDDDASDVASVTSSQWSVRRRRVGPRPLHPAEVPATTTERAQRIAARTAAVAAAQQLVEGGAAGGAASTEATDANGVRLRGNPVVVRGGARVSASRKSSVAVSEEGSPNAQSGQRLSLSASGAASPTLTTVTVSDEDTGELSKSGVSVSLSPITSGARSGRKSLHHTRHGSGGGAARNGSDFLNSADGDGTADEYDAQAEPVPRSTLPVSTDAYNAASRSGPGRVAAGAEKGGRPPLTPRGDASPRLGNSTTVPATTLTSNTVHRHSSSAEYQQQQQQRRRNSIGDAAAQKRGTALVSSTAAASSNGTTTTHRVTEGRRSGAEYDPVGRKSTGEDSIDDTPISVLKERANREAQRNARRDSDQPVVPRLALGEITAKRDRPRRSAAYRVADEGHAEEGDDTPLTGGSVLSDVTVSSMTDSATPHLHNGTRSGRGHGATPDDKTRAEAAAKAKSPPPSEGRPTTTYDSHGASPARPDSAGASSPPGSTHKRETAAATPAAATAPASSTSPPAAAPASTQATASATQTAVATTAAASAPQPAAAPAKPAKTPAAAATTTATTTTANSASAPAVATPGASTTGAGRQSSASPAAAPAAAPSEANGRGAGGAAEQKKRRNFEKNTAAGDKSAPPAASTTKDGAKCCAVM